MKMRAGKLFKVTLTGLGLALAFAGCGSTSSNGGSGGNSNGTGGSGSGGTTGSGGSTSTGGTTGSGGSTSTGGTTGTGGASSTGGTTGTGGANSSGGATSSGGAAGGSSAGGNSGPGGASEAGHTGAGGDSSAGGGSSGSFMLSSPDQTDGAKFNTKFTCAESPAASGKTVGGLGNGINPELDWTGVPSGTMSFAITFLDTTLINANMASLGNHWAIWNIPATVSMFPQGTSMLSGALMMAKQSGAFLAPCAQSLMNSMDDQYEFTIYALSTATLNVSGTGVANAVTALKAITPLATAKLSGHAGLKGN